MRTLMRALRSETRAFNAGFRLVARTTRFPEAVFFATCFDFFLVALAFLVVLRAAMLPLTPLCEALQTARDHE